LADILPACTGHVVFLLHLGLVGLITDAGQFDGAGFPDLTVDHRFLLKIEHIRVTLLYTICETVKKLIQVGNLNQLSRIAKVYLHDFSGFHHSYRPSWSVATSETKQRIAEKIHPPCPILPMSIAS